MNKQQLANKIWESANKMRSKIEANEYKDYILGFIFYKYLSDKEVEFLKLNDFDDENMMLVTEEDEEIVKWLQDNIGYFIGYENLFSTWLKMGKDFSVDNVRVSLSAFSRLISPTHKIVFDGVFETLQTGLSKLGDSASSQTKAISDLIQLIKDIPMDGRQDYDVLGFIYEYLISMFAANAGKKAGEFYTPHEVSLLMSEIIADHLKTRETIKIYDPTSGSGSLLINIGKSVAKYIGNRDNIKYYAQELKQNTYNLTRMNLVMRGIKPDNIAVRNADTLENDWPIIDSNGVYQFLDVDAVVSNPPYSQNWDPSNKETDPRYCDYGLAPKSKADYAFLLHDLYHVKNDGIMTIVLPHGVLFRGGEEGEIRRNLIENNKIDAIMGLPANIFFGTGIPTIIMVLKQRRDNTDILIVDASKGFIKEGKNNKLRASDIKKITDTVVNRLDIPKYSRKVSLEEIRNNDYNLNIPRYVDSSEKAESWDIYASMFGGIPKTEIDEMSEYWFAFPSLKAELFTDVDSEYTDVAVEDIKSVIENNADITAFLESYQFAFSDFAEYLKNELIENVVNVEISKKEVEICNNIFNRLNNIELIDKYEAYQLLDDSWTKTAVDLEIIQTEGFESVKKVDPNMVFKKKNGKEEEVQDGWIGHVIPFELVQQTLLQDDLNSLKEKETELSNISSKYEELFELLTEEDKDSDIVNDDNDGFAFPAVAKEAKRINALIKKGFEVEENSVESVILSVNKQFTREKALKSEIKKGNAELLAKTKETIENLSDEQAKELLFEKWISPLCEKINNLPQAIVSTITDKIKSIMNKYTTTFSDIERDIKSTETELCEMLDALTGNDFDMQGISELKALLGGV